MRCTGVAVALVCAAFTAAAQDTRSADSGSVAGPAIHIEDVDLFYKVYDAANGQPTVEALQRDYLDAGSDGLRQFAKMRNTTATRIAEAIAQQPQIYTDAKRCLVVLPRVRERVAVALRELSRLYPEARFPPVTIAVGRGRPVAVGSPVTGIQIGLEALCATEWMNPNVEDRFVFVIAHEYAHVQQDAALADEEHPTVLAASLMEGAAELTAELIAGHTSYSHLGAATAGHEKEIETTFLADQDKKDLSSWLYNTKPGKPGDLGYWVGYRIAKTYYQRMPDKREALREILTMTDPKAFLARSGWHPGIRLQAESDDTTAVKPLTRDNLESWFDGVIPYALKQADIAGAVVLVLKDGEVLLQKGYGYADVARRIPMDPERTVLGVGSVSKLFTWTAVMQQVERGKLDLDRDINEYLDFKIQPAFGKPITLRHLMTHTAGFEERGFRQLPQGATARSLHDYLRAVPVPERIDPPGEAPAYSNYGAMLGGYLVERASGEPFVEYVERHILEPLGMRRSTFRRPIPESLRSSMAQHYDRASEPALPADNEEPAGDPSGHLLTTAHDISAFMLAHLQRGSYALLEPATLQLMHSSIFVPMPGAQGVALGLFRGDYNGHRVIGHAGDLSGFHADLELLPDEGVGYFVAVNSDGESRGLLEAAYALRASLFHRFMDQYFPAPVTPEEPTVATAREHARLAAGEYEMSRRPSGDFQKALFLAARVAIKANEDGTIETPGWMSLEDNRPQTWREVGPFVWREVGGRARLYMKVENGQVKAWFPGDVFSAWLNVRVPILWSAALNVPLFLAACSVLLAATLFWPAAALVRRRYGRRLELAGRDARAYLWTRRGALVGVLFLFGWALLLIADVPSMVAPEPWIRVVQFIGLLCVAGAAAAVWNVWVTWRGRRSVWAKAWSLLLALALLDLVWFSFAFGLISVQLNY